MLEVLFEDLSVLCYDDLVLNLDFEWFCWINFIKFYCKNHNVLLLQLGLQL